MQWLSHLEGDALNVALLVPEVRRTRLVGTLTEHYGSPGRLADYRRQFEKTARKEGEDPSIFAIALETLAVNAFGDMGHVAQLRLVLDRFMLATTAVLCADILIVWHRRLPSGILLAVVECGRATPTLRFGGLVNLHRESFTDL